jgi:hypothetical protein
MKYFLKKFWLKFKENFNLMKKDKIMTLVLKGGFFLILVSFFVLGVGWGRLPKEVPLFYSLPWGGQQLGSVAGLVFLLLASLGAVFLNWGLAVLVFKDEVFLARTLVCLGLVVVLLVNITIIKITLLMM